MINQTPTKTDFDQYLEEIAPKTALGKMACELSTELYMLKLSNQDNADFHYMWQRSQALFEQVEKLTAALWPTLQTRPPDGFTIPLSSTTQWRERP